MFVLREVFDAPYDEIAEAVDKTPAAVRQIAHRAREHVAARRPRLRVSRAEQQAVVERFLAAVRSGDLQALLDVLAPDVVLVADGGGVVAAALRPIRGRRAGGAPAAHPAPATGRTSSRRRVAQRRAGGADRRRRRRWTRRSSLVVEDGRISRIYAIRNPHKLAGSTRRQNSAGDGSSGWRIPVDRVAVQPAEHLLRLIERAHGQREHQVPEHPAHWAGALSLFTRAERTATFSTRERRSSS